MCSVPDVLQKPFRGDLPSYRALLGQFIHPTADTGELQALIADVAVEGDLIGRGAAFAFSGDEIGEFRLVATAAAILEFRTVAAEAGLFVLGGDALHLFLAA